MTHPILKVAHKTTVITTSLGGMTEWQTANNCLVFKENNVESLTQVLEKILSDKNLQNKLSTSGHSHYLKHFQPERHIDELIHTCQRLIGKGTKHE